MLVLELYVCFLFSRQAVWVNIMKSLKTNKIRGILLIIMDHVASIWIQLNQSKKKHFVLPHTIRINAHKTAHCAYVSPHICLLSACEK